MGSAVGMPLDQRIREELKTGASRRKTVDTLRAEGYSGVTEHQVRRVAVEMRMTSGDTQTRAPSDVILSGLKGRQSQDRPGKTGLNGLVERLTGRDAGELVGVEGRLLDAGSIEAMPIRKLIDIAVGASPEINRAKWDFLRMFSSGYEVEVFKAGTETPDEQGKKLLQGFRDRLEWKHGDESSIYLRLGTAAFMRGGMVMELVMDDAGREPVDIATPDPAAFSFRLIDGDWVLGQQQGSDWVPMDRPTFRHIQLDPKPGRPEGSAPVSSALFPALFLLGLMQDLRRVIANQGYPRLDVSIDLQTLADLIEGTNGKPQLFDSATDLSELLEDTARVVNAALLNMEPGDNFVHGSHYTINQPVGAIGDLTGIDSVINALERMASRALKTSPAFFGITEGASESTANRQWEQLVNGVESVQRPAEKLIESIHEMALQAMGRACTVKFRFAKIRATEELRDEQTRTAKIANVQALLDMGFMTPNQAAQELTGDISPAVELTYEDPDGSAAGMLEPEPPENDTPSTDALGLDGENAIRPAHLRRMKRILPVVPTNTSVSTEDEKAASAEFDDILAAMAGMLEADPV